MCDSYDELLVAVENAHLARRRLTLAQEGEINVPIHESKVALERALLRVREEALRWTPKSS